MVQEKTVVKVPRELTIFIYLSYLWVVVGNKGVKPRGQYLALALTLNYFYSFLGSAEESRAGASTWYKKFVVKPWSIFSKT